MATLNLTMEDFDKVDAKKAAAEKTTFNVSRAFIIVRDFLQPESTIRLDAAADDIVAMLPDEVSSVDSFEFSAMCVELAEQIPYSHPSHIKLARLVFRLARCQKLSYNVMSAGGHEFGTSFQTFKETMRESLPSSPDDETAASYVNFHAFAASLFATTIWSAMPTFAVWTMRDAFEVRPERGCRQDMTVMGAAQYILWDGQGLYKHVLDHDELSDDDYRNFNFGPKYSGKDRLGRERWDFWKQGFRNASVKKGFAPECRAVAEKAANMMDVLDQSMGV